MQSDSYGKHLFLHHIVRNGMILLICLLVSGFILTACGKKEESTEEPETVQNLLPVEKIPTTITSSNEYDEECFVQNGSLLSYEDDTYYSEQGIDVSGYSGEIDWQRVKDAGIDFVFIRLGYRGYTEGGLNLDSCYETNMQGAAEAGLKIGVYFYAQAVSEEEAQEEARFVLDNLEGYTLRMPVVYDQEHVESPNARTNDVTGEQFTANAHAFCDVIREAGYEPAVYCNTVWQDNVIDMSQLDNMVIWYAGYASIPQSKYHFEFWQYTSQGHIDGFADDVAVDMDIRFVPKRPS